jgi:hypothetical protein
MSIKYLALVLLVVANCSADQRDPRNIGRRQSQHYRNNPEENKGYEEPLAAVREEREQQEESLTQTDTDNLPSADQLKVLREERKQQEESIEEKNAKQDKELVDKLRLAGFSLILATFYQQSEPGVMTGIGIVAGLALAGIGVGSVCDIRK